MDEEERRRMTARLDELGYETVRSLMSMSRFPHTWELGVHQWLGEQERKRDANPQATG